MCGKLLAGDKALYRGQEVEIIHNYGNGKVEVRINRFRVELLEENQLTRS